jgi:hypothetical protein
MNERLSRRGCLTLVAIVNLLLWLAIAAGVGLLVSDVVDLGVETYVRERQATAVALWERVVAGATARATVATATALANMPTQTVAPTETEAGPSNGPAQATPVRPSPTPSPAERSTASATAEPSPRATRTATTTPRPTPTSTATAPPVATDPPTPAPITSPLLMANPNIERLMGLDAEMEQSALGRPVQIRYNEATLNQEIAALVAGSPDLPYQNVQVDLGRDQVILTGAVSVVGFDVDTEVSGAVVALDCAPRVEVADIRIAGFLTPGFVKDNIEEIVAESLDWYPPDYPLCLEQIVLEEGRLTVYGSRR